MVCASCGEHGAGYCPIVDEDGNPHADWYHAVCYSKEYGPREFTTFRSNAQGRPRRYSLPHNTRIGMRQMRIPKGRMAAPVPPSLYGLQGYSRGL